METQQFILIGKVGQTSRFAGYGCLWPRTEWDTPWSLAILVA